MPLHPYHVDETRNSILSRQANRTSCAQYLAGSFVMLTMVSLTDPALGDADSVSQHMQDDDRENDTGCDCCCGDEKQGVSLFPAL